MSVALNLKFDKKVSCFSQPGAVLYPIPAHGRHTFYASMNKTKWERDVLFNYQMLYNCWFVLLSLYQKTRLIVENTWKNRKDSEAVAV